MYSRLNSRSVSGDNFITFLDQTSSKERATAVAAAALYSSGRKERSMYTISEKLIILANPGIVVQLSSTCL